MGKKLGESIQDIVQNITSDVGSDPTRAIDNLNVHAQPSFKTIVGILHNLFRIVYPGYYVDETYQTFNVRTTVAATVEDVASKLNHQIALALRFDKELQSLSYHEIADRADEITLEFMQQIPTIREYLETDVQALFDGDPAANSTDEIIIAYPGLYAISTYRFAHELYIRNVPIIPRIMTEHAHSETGIDITPGATIGKYFFIDHGTGIVVGETTHIGEHVKLYQGVTLGALSTSGGQALHNVIRHPTIEDYVTVYSNASILGGETVIGEGSVIGGSVFLTRSVPPHTKVYAKSKELHFNNDQSKADKSAAEEVDQPWFYII